METHLQHTFSVAEAKAKYDAYVKELLADKEILDKIPVFGNISKGVDTMCNLSEGIYENGLKQGFAEGKLEGRLLMLFELMRDKQFPIRYAVKKASEFGIKDEADFRSRSALAGYDLSEA
ncbi:hypothetical protein [Clostridium vitabionis]|uniref:hypothetical protein n=1 Tax=Clostridium vitabionis TaxID=2784388 RepID=UPI00188BADC2|nr:hypothetical protein [Clostridium vitabionis]